MQSEKKFCYFLPYSLSVDCVLNYVDKFHSHFIAHHYDNSGTAKNYVLGLLKCSKGEANMERMEEEIEKSEYRAYQQFISNSNWDSPGLQKSVAQEASALLSSQKGKRGLDTGYIIDESGHMKKGKMSVGVSRQYAGVSGKVDNCQVGVYSSLVNEKYATIINERIFLPKSW
jgi:SRSO17 transposase